MAVSNVITQATGTAVRSGMCVVDMDGLDNFLIGTVIGVTIGTTDADGDDIHVANVQAFTSAVEMSGWELMQAWAEKISDPSGGVLGANAYAEQQQETGQMILHVESVKSDAAPLAWNVSLATPTFVPGT